MPSPQFSNFSLGFVYPYNPLNYLTRMLLHFDGTDTSTTITDSATNAHTLVANGNAQLDTAQKKFGASSLLLDGTGDNVTLSGSSAVILPGGSGDLALGTGDWTIEAWVNMNNSSGSRVVYDGRPAGGNGAYPLVFAIAGNMNLFVNSAIKIAGSSSVAGGAWHHVAVARLGTATKMFIDGVQDGLTFTDTTNYLAVTDRPRIGDSTDTGAGWDGWIDELRVSIGIARYTGTFTPPTAAFTPD